MFLWTKTKLKHPEELMSKNVQKCPVLPWVSKIGQKSLDIFGHVGGTAPNVDFPVRDMYLTGGWVGPGP